jgi:diaminopimelate epimerase
MDYRNADGSIAQMCGNGLRVFVRWLLEEDLATGDVIEIGTRAGLRRASLGRDGRISVTMGVPHLSGDTTKVQASSRTWEGHPVDVGNPHCVVRLSSVEELAGLDLSGPVHVDHFPDGVNVEFVVEVGKNHLTMRVHERGVGETMSCGTGVVAAAFDHRHAGGDVGSVYRVDVPGGGLKVEFAPTGEALLTGSAYIVARGEVVLPDAR